MLFNKFSKITNARPEPLKSNITTTFKNIFLNCRYFGVRIEYITTIVYFSQYQSFHQPLQKKKLVRFILFIICSVITWQQISIGIYYVLAFVYLSILYFVPFSKLFFKMSSSTFALNFRIKFIPLIRNNIIYQLCNTFIGYRNPWYLT